MKTIPNFQATNVDIDSEGVFYLRARPSMIAIARSFRHPDLVDDIVSHLAEQLWRSGKWQSGLWLYRRAWDFMKREAPDASRRQTQMVSLEYLVMQGWQFDEQGNMYEPRKGETG